jgi:hypothetical protein
MTKRIILKCGQCKKKWLKGKDYPELCPNPECKSPDWEFKPQEYKMQDSDLVIATIERDVFGELRFFPTGVKAPMTYKDLANLAIFIAEND